MNLFHRWYCNSRGWARALQDEMMPAVLRGLDLGGDVLELGPGPGLSTDWLRARVPHITSIEVDARL
ncbi:MAG: SAM-dependent methyltransferase, partial [Dehalococcoidia bacterium]